MALTKLAKGVFVKIKEDQLKVLQEEHKGFLSRQNYIPEYEEIAKDDEIGRFNIFRFVLDK